MEKSLFSADLVSDAARFADGLKAAEGAGELTVVRSLIAVEEMEGVGAVAERGDGAAGFAAVFAGGLDFAFGTHDGFILGDGIG